MRSDRRWMKKGGVGFLAAALWAFPLLQGCFDTAVVVDHALVDKAEETRVFADGPDAVYAATLEALRQLRVEVKKTVRDNLGADIDGTGPTGESVTVRLDRSGERQTAVRARIGRWGNRDAAARLFALIAEKLPPRP
jgi:hypothetical protein